MFQAVHDTGGAEIISGISRVRNEALILEDTLRHFLGYCDRIVIYDDCSTDESPEIADSFDDVTVIRGTEWDANQHAAETRHRAACLERVRDADMVLCFDADERLDGELPTGRCGYTFRLYDGYLTEDRQEPYTEGPLESLPRWWGPECREILMYFDPRHAQYYGRGRREPGYSRYFPQWRAKWEGRKGNAIHARSDFGAELMEWHQL